MAIDTTALNKLITDFRALSQKDSVSPESLGSLLQKLADLLASCPADSEVNNSLNSVNRTITSLQSALQNIERSAVTTDELNKALKGKADDFAYYVDTDTIEFKPDTLKVASMQIAMAIAGLVNGNKVRDKNIADKADKTELRVVLASMGVAIDNVDNTGNSAIMYVANVGDVYYSEGKEHLFYKKSEAETLDLGVPSREKIYANAMTKRLYIWRGGTWQQCGGGGIQIDAYTKAESDARYLRGDWVLIGEVSEYDTSKNSITIVENCDGYKELAVRRINSDNSIKTNVYLNIGGVSVSLQSLSPQTKDAVWHIVQDGNNLSVEFLYCDFVNTGSRLKFPTAKNEYRLNNKIGGKVELEFYTLTSLHSGENIKVYGKR